MLALCILGFGFWPPKQTSWLALPRHIRPRAAGRAEQCGGTMAESPI